MIIKVFCRHCQSDRLTHRQDTPEKMQCSRGTIFEHLSTDLRKWMYAIHLFLNSKKGISGYQLQREIRVTYKTA